MGTGRGTYFQLGLDIRPRTGNIVKSSQRIANGEDIVETLCFDFESFTNARIRQCISGVNILSSSILSLEGSTSE